MKLKTIMDMGVYSEPFSPGEIPKEEVAKVDLVIDLRQAAIDWVKYLRKQKGKRNSISDEMHIIGQIWTFKNFFKLTKEDLE